MGTRVLIVEDDFDITEILEKILTGEGYETKVSRNGNHALEVFDSFNPHLVLLDLGLPGMGGLEVCKRIRASADAVIIVLTARDQSQSHIESLDTGADDYVTKPFRREELLARIRSQLRRSPPSDPDLALYSDLVLDRKKFSAQRGGRDLELTRGEFKMLLYLIEHPNQAISREAMLREVWGWEAGDAATNTVDMFVSNLRKKMEAGGEERLLKTRHGVGYII
jgi:two-component system response regulator MprA